MGSIVGAATFPLAVWLMQKDLTMLAAALIAGAFITYKHSSNIQRLHDGTEHVFTFGGKKSA
jgi:glycerol-3-phosphate acyltransferase PlsY